MHGGGHERGHRSGTLNVPGIVGFGEACRIAGEEWACESRRIEAFRDRFERDVIERIDHVLINGGGAARLPNTSNVAFRYIEAEALLTRMHDVAASTGSACSSADRSSSHVLEAMGLAPRDAQGSVRFSLGRWTTADQIALVVEALARQVACLRELSPLYEIEVTGAGGAQGGS
jgi:cysteine desulfurase